MCAAIIAYFPFIIVINKNRRAPAVKYDHTASSGGLWPLLPVQRGALGGRPP